MWKRKEMTHILEPRLALHPGGRLSCTDAMDPDQYASLGMLNEIGALVDAENSRVVIGRLCSR
jgi:hypothetical protein